MEERRVRAGAGIDPLLRRRNNKRYGRQRRRSAAAIRGRGSRRGHDGCRSVAVVASIKHLGSRRGVLPRRTAVNGAIAKRNGSKRQSVIAKRNSRRRRLSANRGYEQAARRLSGRSRQAQSAVKNCVRFRQPAKTEAKCAVSRGFAAVQRAGRRMSPQPAGAENARALRGKFFSAPAGFVRQKRRPALNAGRRFHFLRVFTSTNRRTYSLRPRLPAASFPSV